MFFVWISTTDEMILYLVAWFLQSHPIKEKASVSQLETETERGALSLSRHGLKTKRRMICWNLRQILARSDWDWSQVWSPSDCSPCGGCWRVACGVWRYTFFIKLYRYRPCPMCTFFWFDIGNGSLSILVWVLSDHTLHITTVWLRSALHAELPNRFQNTPGDCVV